MNTVVKAKASGAHRKVLLIRALHHRDAKERWKNLSKITSLKSFLTILTKKIIQDYQKSWDFSRNTQSMISLYWSNHCRWLCQRRQLALIEMILIRALDLKTFALGQLSPRQAEVLKESFEKCAQILQFIKAKDRMQMITNIFRLFSQDRKILCLFEKYIVKN